jgi:hypothetical protein
MRRKQRGAWEEKTHMVVRLLHATEFTEFREVHRWSACVKWKMLWSREEGKVGWLMAGDHGFFTYHTIVTSALLHIY